MGDDLLEKVGKVDSPEHDVLCQVSTLDPTCWRPPEVYDCLAWLLMRPVQETECGSVAAVLGSSPPPDVGERFPRARDSCLCIFWVARRVYPFEVTCFSLEKYSPPACGFLSDLR